MTTLLAVHGSFGPSTIERFAECAERFHASSPSVTVSLTGHGAAAKTMPFEQYRTKLSGSIEGLRAVEVYSPAPSSERTLVRDWQRACTIHVAEGVATFVQALPFAADEVGALVQSFAGDISYGFVKKHPKGKGPVLYAVGLAMGIGYSSEEMAEADEIGRWMHELDGDRRHLRGLLRDVYEFNILSNVHLQQDVTEGESLESWIKKESSRGTVAPLAVGTYLWRVVNPRSAREQLLEAGVSMIGPRLE